MKRILIQLTEEQLNKLREEKEQTGCSISSQLRMILSDYWRDRDAA